MAFNVYSITNFNYICYNCYNLQEVNIQSSSSHYGSNLISAFEKCYNLINLSISTNGLFQGDNMCKDCYNLINFNQQDGYMGIFNNQFANCYNLNSTLKLNLYVMGIYAASSSFYECRNLPTPEMIVSRGGCIGTNTFYNCINMRDDINIHLSGVTNSFSIYSNAIYNCSNLNNFYIDASNNYAYTVSIFNEAFYKSTNLTVGLIGESSTFTLGDTSMSTIKRLCTNEGITQAYGATELTHHEPEVEPEKIEPTCTKEGSIGSWKCIHCGYTMQKKILPAKGHTPDEEKMECSVCKTKIIEIKTKSIWKESHSGSTYYFVQNGDVWSSNNQSKNSSSAQSTFTTTLNKNTNISIPWSVSSENNYDKLTITLDGVTKVNAVSGTKTGTITETLSKGTHTLVVKYSKDGSGNTGSDTASITLSDKETEYIYEDTTE